VLHKVQKLYKFSLSTLIIVVAAALFLVPDSFADQPGEKQHGTKQHGENKSGLCINLLSRSFRHIWTGLTESLLPKKNTFEWADSDAQTLEAIFQRMLPHPEAQLFIDSHRAFRKNQSVKGSKLALLVNANQFLPFIAEAIPEIEIRISRLETSLRRPKTNFPYVRTWQEQALELLKQALQTSRMTLQAGQLSYSQYYSVGAALSLSDQAWAPATEFRLTAVTNWISFEHMQAHLETTLDQYFPFIIPIFGFGEVPLTQFNGAWGLGYRMIGFAKTGNRVEVDGTEFSDDFSNHDWGHDFVSFRMFRSYINQFKKNYRHFFDYVIMYSNIFDRFSQMRDANTDPQVIDLFNLSWFLIEHEYGINMTSPAAVKAILKQRFTDSDLSFSELQLRRAKNPKDFAGAVTRAESLNLLICTDVVRKLTVLFD
jgi:hypothetical protein